MSKVDTVNEYIKNCDELLEHHKGNEDTDAMKELAHELCLYYVKSIPQFENYLEHWENHPVRLKIIRIRLIEFRDEQHCGN